MRTLAFEHGLLGLPTSDRCCGSAAAGEGIPVLPGTTARGGKMRIKRLIVVAALAVAAVAAAPASAHNAGHIILPDGTCLDVGSSKDAPLVPEQNPNRNATTGQLDLIPGSGDQYGARFAATQGNTSILPGNCP
jgi:hypothetical protein